MTASNPWRHGVTILEHTTPRYDKQLLDIGPDPDPTHILHAYGYKDDREAITENMLPALAVKPKIVHHRRLWRGSVLEPINHELSPVKGQFKWQHLAVIGALIFVIGVVVYQAGWGMK